MATEQLIKLLAQTSGRDKIYRSIQYGGKFLWWSLEQQGDQDEIVKKLKILETHLSTGRKLFRIANSISLLKAALKNMQNDDVVLRLVVTLSKLNSAFYLLFDHIIWANRIGLVKVDQKYYSKLSNRFWLATLILNLTRDLYEFLLLANDLPQLAKECGENGQSRRFSPTDDSFGRHNNNGTLNGVPRRRVNWHSDVTDHVTDRVSPNSIIAVVWSNRKEVVLDTMKNACDLVLPASSLGYLDLNPGQQGLFGLMSSLIGLLTVWDTRYKL